MDANITLSVDVPDGPHAAVLRAQHGLHDRGSTVLLHATLPLEERPWQVGLIVGPSGSGKSSLARELFPGEVVTGYDWPEDLAVMDGFDAKAPVHTIARVLSSVGFSSPPSWQRPFRVLSNGERFRVTVARALLDPRPRVVVDEFTSVVDRAAARGGAFATGKAVRRTPGKQFVAVTCHDDVEAWLRPDWTLHTGDMSFVWNAPGAPRPGMSLEVVRVHADAWVWFAPHHYMTATLNPSARCFLGIVDGRPAVFIAVLPQPHHTLKNAWRFSRVVVLPDFQGLGLAFAAMDAVGAVAKTALGADMTMAIAAAHPALLHTLAKSPLWNMSRPPGLAVRGNRSANPGLFATHAFTRHTATFRYVGGAHPDTALARALWSTGKAVQ